MSQYQRSRSSLFLMELLINILLFCALCAFGLLFFIKSNHMTQDTTDLHHAVSITSSIASVYENGDGTINSLQALYPASHFENTDGVTCLMIFYDKEYVPCTEESAVYRVACHLMPADSTTEGKVHYNRLMIHFYRSENELIYSINACQYTPTLDAKGVAQ